MKKNGQGSYPIGHIKYGTMGPKTFDEYQSLNFSNRTINKIKKKHLLIPQKVKQQQRKQLKKLVKK